MNLPKITNVDIMSNEELDLYHRKNQILAYLDFMSLCLFGTFAIEFKTNIVPAFLSLMFLSFFLISIIYIYSAVNEKKKRGVFR